MLFACIEATPNRRMHQFYFKVHLLVKQNFKNGPPKPPQLISFINLDWEYNHADIRSRYQVLVNLGSLDLFSKWSYYIKFLRKLRQIVLFK